MGDHGLQSAHYDNLRECLVFVCLCGSAVFGATYEDCGFLFDQHVSSAARAPSDSVLPAPVKGEPK